MKLIFVTYSSGQPYENFALKLVSQAKEQFDEVKHFKLEDIMDFKNKNQHIWNHKCEMTGSKENGFWIWKPYIISVVLNQLPASMENIIVYCDAKYSLKSDIVNPIKKYFQEIASEYLFKLDTHHFTNKKYLEKNYSKGDAYNLVGVHMNECDYHSWAGFFCLRNCEKSRIFIDKWNYYCSNERIVTDIPSQTPNHRDFIQNRYDQTVFSLLIKKFEIYCKDSELSQLLSGNPTSDIIQRIG